MNLTGTLLISDVAETYKSINASLADQEKLTLDLGELSDCDTAGAQLLYSIAKSEKDAGRVVEMVNVPGSVKSALERIGLDLKSTTDIWKEATNNA